MGVKAKFIIFLLAVCIVGLLPASCADGVIGIEGIAYEWVDAQESFEGNIYIDEDVDLSDKNLQPLGGVQLSESYSNGTVISNASGAFDLFGMGAPGRYTVTVTANKDGYNEVIKTFFHNASQSYRDVIVIMVRAE